MRYRSAAFALLFLVAPGHIASAQSYATQGIESYLRVEWEPSAGRRGPILAGYVSNVSGYTADRVQLAIDLVDGSGRVTSSSTAYVLGTVPPYGRAYFEVPVRDGGSYRVRVLTFDPIGRG